MTKHYFTQLLLAALILACITGAAQAEVITSWKIEGPAFSKHLNGQGGAPVVGQTVHPEVYYNANVPMPASAFQNPPAPLPTVAEYCNAFPQAGRKPCVERYGSAYQIVSPKRKFNEGHAEIGLEYNERDTNAGTVKKYFGGIVKDSNFRLSAYAGGSYQWNWYESQNWRIDGGALAMIWRRSIVNKDDTVSMRWIATVLPVLTIENKPLHVGVNVSYAPRMSYHGQVMNAADTIMVQVVWSL